MTLLRLYPIMRVGAKRTPYNLTISIKWHSNRFDRPRKYLGDNILNMYCSLKKSIHETVTDKKSSGGA